MVNSLGQSGLGMLFRIRQDHLVVVLQLHNSLHLERSQGTIGGRSLHLLLLASVDWRRLLHPLLLVLVEVNLFMQAHLNVLNEVLGTVESISNLALDVFEVWLVPRQMRFDVQGVRWLVWGQLLLVGDRLLFDGQRDLLNMARQSVLVVEGAFLHPLVLRSRLRLVWQGESCRQSLDSNQACHKQQCTWGDSSSGPSGARSHCEGP
mmetsp:Transcript_18164/g.42462  ORF Transcript_18164/g.42462 Transcript_18164/m.42462 type:complete len:206 (+) Transcript_18164:606-1223(+)